jgi:hypothetical protein
MSFPNESQYKMTSALVMITRKEEPDFIVAH